MEESNKSSLSAESKDNLKKLIQEINPDAFLIENNLDDKTLFVIEKLKSGGFLVFVSNGVKNRFYVDSYDEIIAILKSYK